MPLSVQDQIENAARAHGVDPTALLAIARIESGNNPDARNPSGAAGLFQFMPSTARAYGLSNPYDAAAASDAAARLARDNTATLSRALGRAPTTGELYLAHQQGPGGASALLANPGANVVDVLANVYGSRSRARAAVTQNGGHANMTAGQFSNIWTSRAENTASLIPPGSIPDVGSELSTVSPVAQAMQRAAGRVTGKAGDQIPWFPTPAPLQPAKNVSGSPDERGGPIVPMPRSRPASAPQPLSDKVTAISVAPNTPMPFARSHKPATASVGQTSPISAPVAPAFAPKPPIDVPSASQTQAESRQQRQQKPFVTFPAEKPSNVIPLGDVMTSQMPKPAPAPADTGVTRETTQQKLLYTLFPEKAPVGTPFSRPQDAISTTPKKQKAPVIAAPVDDSSAAGLIDIHDRNDDARAVNKPIPQVAAAAGPTIAAQPALQAPTPHPRPVTAAPVAPKPVAAPKPAYVQPQPRPAAPAPAAAVAAQSGGGNGGGGGDGGGGQGSFQGTSTGNTYNVGQVYETHSYGGTQQYQAQSNGSFKRVA